eukprot:SAG11_NODE_2245_length_3641_cov_2.290514_2_plen_125_part_00
MRSVTAARPHFFAAPPAVYWTDTPWRRSALEFVRQELADARRRQPLGQHPPPPAGLLGRLERLAAAFDERIGSVESETDDLELPAAWRPRGLPRCHSWWCARPIERPPPCGCTRTLKYVLAACQ